MNAKPLFFHLLLASVLFLSCRSLTDFTPPGDSAPLRIAVIPCEITKPWSDYSGLEKLRVETSLSVSLQAEVYQNLLEQVLAHHSSTVALQAYSDTNDLLNARGIRPQEAWQLSSAELAQLLDVDAVLRISIMRDPGSVRQDEAYSELYNRVLIDDSIVLDPDRTLVSAGLFDGWTGIPLWSIGQPDPVRFGRKHKKIARRIVRKLGRKLP